MNEILSQFSSRSRNAKRLHSRSYRGIYKVMKESKGLLLEGSELNTSTSILRSKVIKLEQKQDFLTIFAQNDQYKGKRFFWKSPDGASVFAGIGICKMLQSNGMEQIYEEVEKEWQELLDGSEINNPFQTAGVGPMLFGGFSFDPKKTRTNLWDNFKDAHFYLPAIMFSEIDGEQYVTVNQYGDRNDLVEVIQACFEKLEKSEDTSTVNTHSNKLLDSKEINGDQWKRMVSEVVQDLGQSLKKVVLARESRLVFEQDITTEAVLENLLNRQKNSYVFALESGKDCFIGASPERLVKKAGKQVFSVCLAGSIARGMNEEDDESLGQELMNDPKNRVEHDYVVQMIRSAMEKVCSTFEIPNEPCLLKMRDIQHLFTPVTGTLLKSASVLSLIELLHPTPALGGYPQALAIEKIREAEMLDRGLYGAPIGWLDYRGNGEFAVSIRSALIQKNEASLFAGCGVVKDSDAEMEFKETAIKFKPMLSALGGQLG